MGIDTTNSSVPYLASWAEQAPIETIEATAALIDRLARRLEQAVADVDLSHPCAAAAAVA